MMVYGLKESNKYCDNYNLFKTKQSRENHLKLLLEEYSAEYGKKINSIEDLDYVTFGEVFITVFDEEIYE